MKLKTIKKTLRAKFDEWVASIKHPGVQELARKNTIITGGSIVSMLLKEEVKDFDLYFRNFETCKAVVEYYTQFVDGVSLRIDGQHISIRVENNAAYKGEEEEASDESKDEEGLYTAIYMSSNAITLSDKIQLVCRFYGNPEEIHANYDYVHCTCYWKSWDDELVTSKEALVSILTKELRYVGSKYPLCSLIRMRKFIQRGWMINAGQILKMVMQLNALDLTDLKILEDQLVGVDSAYFAQVIQQLSDKQAELGSPNIDHTYLMTIIDRIF